MNNKLRFGALAVCLVLSTYAPALAQAVGTPSDTQLQQQKREACDTQATGKSLSGEARKTFMDECLATPGMPVANNDDRNARRESCRAQAIAKNLSGDSKKAFINLCLNNIPVR
jgi:endonuclease/exonuclease/phosphatase (EEP) superfamily protein YafD